MIVEGVRYCKFEIRFTLANGKRRRWMRWSPDTGQYIGSEVSRELRDTYTLAEAPQRRERRHREEAVMPRYGKHPFPKTLREFVVAMKRVEARAFRNVAQAVTDSIGPPETRAETRARIEVWARSRDLDADYLEKPTTAIDEVIRQYEEAQR